MKFPDYSLTDQEVGDLEIVGMDGNINSDLYNYLKAQLVAAQTRFIESNMGHSNNNSGCFLNDLEVWAVRLERHRPDIALRLKIVARVLKAILAFEPQEAKQFLPPGLVLRDTWQPVVEGAIVSLRKQIAAPYLLGSLSLIVREAFISREVN